MVLFEVSNNNHSQRTELDDLHDDLNRGRTILEVGEVHRVGLVQVQRYPTDDDVLNVV